MKIKALTLDPRVTVRNAGAPDPEGECVVNAGRKFESKSYIAQIEELEREHV